MNGNKDVENGGDPSWTEPAVKETGCKIDFKEAEAQHDRYHTQYRQAKQCKGESFEVPVGQRGGNEYHTEDEKGDHNEELPLTLGKTLHMFTQHCTGIAQKESGEKCGNVAVAAKMFCKVE